MTLTLSMLRHLGMAIQPDGCAGPWQDLGARSHTGGVSTDNLPT